MEARFAIIDPAAGISGDMMLGALIDAGAPRDWLQGLPRRLGIPEVTVGIERVERNGMAATKVTVTLPGERVEEPGQPHQASPAGHAGRDRHGAHRRVGELVRLIEQADVSEWVRVRACRAFELIGWAEGRVHGQAPESVTLHEVGALDAVVDLVAGIEGFQRLGVTRVHTRPVGLGTGWVNSAHGAIPVPAPATGLLLEGLAIGPPGPVTGEATTPTGAALLRVLTDDAGPFPTHWRLTGNGWGAGTRDPEGYANVLRIILAEGATEAESVATVATDVDDMNPEYIEPLRQALTEAGALDVQIWSTIMKKGRPGFRVEALAPTGRAEAVAEAFFRHSTTAGVRIWESKRMTLARRQITVATAAGAVRVKVLDGPEGTRAKPEYDDVVRVARAGHRPAHVVAGEVKQKVVELASKTSGAGPDATNKES